jgi:hypothetical protein
MVGSAAAAAAAVKALALMSSALGDSGARIDAVTTVTAATATRTSPGARTGIRSWCLSPASHRRIQSGR